MIRLSVTSLVDGWVRSKELGAYFQAKLSGIWSRVHRVQRVAQLYGFGQYKETKEKVPEIS